MNLLKGSSQWRMIVIIVACCLLSSRTFSANPVIQLAGKWRLQLDRKNIGLKERWFGHSLKAEITLPGSLSAEGIGDNITVSTNWMGDIIDSTWFKSPEFEKYRHPGNVKIPFWLQPDKYYAGVAWYQRDIEIASDWQGKRVVLFLERPHWETHVWWDTTEIGSNTSLSTPHEYELGTSLTPGRHQLTIRVDNSLIVDIGINSHSITDHTQGNWNGIVGQLALYTTEPVWIDDLQVYPDVMNKSIEVKGTIGNLTGRAGSGTVKLQVNTDIEKNIPITWNAQGGSFETRLFLGDAVQPWDEFNPILYNLTVMLNEWNESKTVRFGLRNLSTRGTQFILNGLKIFFRGTLECAIFPKTGHPPTDVESWKHVIAVSKAHGLNLFRFHSWCPPEAAFIAADEMGFYYHVEAASWANQSTTLGDGKPVDQWIYAETDKILKAYGHHPSFMLMSCSNEPGGEKSNAFLAQWVNHYKEKDRRRLFTSASGWPQLSENQFHVTPDPRIQSWGAGLSSRINSQIPETFTDYRKYIQERTVPVISHEIGQWCAYPNFEEIKKYTGYLKPKNFEIFCDGLNSHHMGKQAHDFLIASGKLQTLCYKEEIESALRTPGMGGFELLDLHDFPGQGTALVGVLDPFWDSKGYVLPEQYRRFCNSTVPLARMSKRVFTTDDTLEALIEVAHFGPRPMASIITYWKLIDSWGHSTLEGKLPSSDLPIDNGISLGRVHIPLRNISAPAKYKLTVGLEGTGFENDWDIWVYPKIIDMQIPNDIKLFDNLTDSALAVLHAGGKVLLMIPPGRVKGDTLGKVALGFSPIFWNTAWTNRQAPHTLGILCDPKNPALLNFPTEFHSNYQWWYIISRASAIILDNLPPDIHPIVQVIDDWVTNRKLGLIFEAKVGKGRLVVSSIDLKNDLNGNPVARQMLYSLLRYMESDQFQPTVDVTADQVQVLITEPTLMQKFGARVVHVDSEERGNSGENVIDGDRSTIWHTEWSNKSPDFPHEIIIELKHAVKLRGVTILPRQDNNRNGWIKEYEFFISMDGISWGTTIAKGFFDDGPTLKTILFSSVKKGKFIRLVAMSGYAAGPWASAAELSVIVE